MNLSVNIQATNRTSRIHWPSFSISDRLNSQNNTCNFTVKVYASGWKPVVGNTITVLDGATKIFAGSIVRITKKPKGAILKQERQTVQLLPHEKTELEILERNIEKNGFDCIIRMFYHVQDAEKFHLNRGVFTVVNAMKSFGKPGFNEFKFDTITVDGDTPFLDPTGEYTEGKRRWTWFLFKLRTGFYHEGEGLEGDWATFKSIFRKWWVGKNTEWALSAWGELKEYYGMPGQFKHRHDGNVYIFNTEELATLWHFPGKAFGNATGRVESVKSEPPTNLPL
jgi:hypothetical protein